MNMDHSAWEGFEIDGHVDTVLSRGKVIVDDGEYLGAKGDGRFLKRGLSQYLTDRLGDRERSEQPWTSESSSRPTRPPSRTVQLAKLAEAHGFSHVWTFDSHLLWEEPYVIYIAILAETQPHQGRARSSRTRRPATGRSRHPSSPRSTRCTATARSAASAAATRRCASRTASR